MILAKVVLVTVLVVVMTHIAAAGKLYGHRQYKFSYAVKDTHTGDYKSQYESRDGDKVKGEYRIAQPDGLVRIVKYVANGKDGFRAQVLHVPSKKSHKKEFGDDEDDDD